MSSPFPFDVTNPPDEPPAACRDVQRWHTGNELRRVHQPDSHGACKVCGVVGTCFLYKAALRALVDARTVEQRHQPMQGQPRLVARSRCRWCGQEVELHSVYGWVHMVGAFILCRELPPGVPLSVAEPVR